MFDQSRSTYCIDAETQFYFILFFGGRALSHKLWTWNQCVTADGSLSTVIFLPRFPRVSELSE